MERHMLLDGKAVTVQPTKNKAATVIFMKTLRQIVRWSSFFMQAKQVRSRKVLETAGFKLELSASHVQGVN